MPSPSLLPLLLLLLLSTRATPTTTPLGPSSGGRRLSPSSQFVAPFLLPPLLVESAAPPPGVAPGRPEVNVGGPCVVAPSSATPASFAFLAGAAVADDDAPLPAARFALHGAACVGRGGAAGWTARETPPAPQELPGADRAFRFLLPVLTDPGRSDSNWIVLEEDGGGEVWCGENARVRRWLLVRPVRNPRSFGRSPLRKGGRYAIMDVVDRSGKAWTCAYGTNSVEEEEDEEDEEDGGVERGSAGGNVGSGRGENGGERVGGVEDSAERGDGGGKLSGGEIAGIAAGMVGVVIALGIVVVAAVLWRRQRRVGEDEETQREDEDDPEYPDDGQSGDASERGSEGVVEVDVGFGQGGATAG